MTKKKFSSTEPKGFQICIYTRVSTEEQAENPEGSIKNQEERLREYVKLKNMIEPFGEIVTVFSDPGVSAKNMNRPGFQRMLRAIENHDVNLVLVTELSRFSRSTKDFAILQEFLSEHDCKFMSIRENFDTSGAAGSMVLNLMASIAEFERRQTAERISHSFLARAKRGLYNGGSVPLGYRIDPEKPGMLFVIPEESELVRLIFKTFLQEQTLAATAKKLNSLNVRLPRNVRGGGSVRSREIRFNSIYRILKNKAYVGIRVFKSKGVLEEVPAVWEPIIDGVTFARVQKMLEANCCRRKTHLNKYPFILSGLIFCKECGERMSGASATSGTGKRIGYYEHVATRKKESSLNYKLLQHKPRRIPAQKIEELVWSEIKKFILEDSFANLLLDRARKIQENKSGSSKTFEVETKIKTLDRQISILAERISELPSDIDPKPLIEKLRELQQMQKQWSANLTKLQETSPTDASIVSFESLDLFRNGLVQLLQKVELDPTLKVKIARLVLNRIVVSPIGFELQFHIGEGHYKIASEEMSSGAHPLKSNFGVLNQKNCQISRSGRLTIWWPRRDLNSHILADTGF